MFKQLMSVATMLAATKDIEGHICVCGGQSN